MYSPDLSNLVAVVTGSATGIGRQIAMKMADCGATLIIHYRSSETEANAVVDEIRDSGGNAITIQADITRQKDVQSAFSKIQKQLGTVDILVNNVGAFAPRHWEELSPSEWHQVIDTNLIGTYLCTKAALPDMRKQEFGRIINIGYASADRGLVNPKNFPYFVAKQGVLMFTRMVAADTQDDGITVNAVSPYVVENSDEFPESLPRGRPASFSDIVQPVMFFLDTDSEYISGANIEVDGGWLPEQV
ncbi:MAG: SDR family NAD(P)-dependent oxidoreductase [Halobacteriaceae archaeon]